MAKDACFTFRPDQFVEYGLFYDCKHCLHSSCNFFENYLPSLIGYVEKMPEALVGCSADKSLFEKTELCKFDRIMVGATQFANQSCRPNCKYTIFDTGKRNAIKLEILQVNSGDEITVFILPKGSLETAIKIVSILTKIYMRWFQLKRWQTQSELLFQELVWYTDKTGKYCSSKKHQRLKKRKLGNTKLSWYQFELGIKHAWMWSELRRYRRF